MTKPKAGSIRGGRGKVSIWRVPNFLLEARGYFLPQHDAPMERLARFRTLGAGLIVIGMTIHYGGLEHTGLTAAGTDANASTIYNVNTPEGAWLVGIIITILAAICVIPVIAVVLALTAERGYRLATLWQMRWVVVSFLSFCGLWAVIGLIASETYNVLAPHRSNGNLVALIGAGLLALVVLVLCVAWGVRSLHLIAGGLFRADDAHPLLGPVSAIPVAWAAAIVMYLARGNGGLTGVPDVVADLAAFGGAATITGLSVFTILRLRRNPHWPFRRGRVPLPVSPPRMPQMPYGPQAAYGPQIPYGSQTTYGTQGPQGSQPPQGPYPGWPHAR